MNGSQIASRDRSYTAETFHPVGSMAAFGTPITSNKPNRDFTEWTEVHIPAGTPVRILSYTNAGFRGIEVSVRIPGGTTLHGLPAGDLI